MKELKKMKTLLISLTLGALASCGNYEESKGFVETSSSRAIGAESVTFTEVKEQVFASSCTSCHVQYDNYESVLKDIAAIRGAVESNRMPKNSGPLTEAQKSLLFAWIDAGAPNTGADSGPPTRNELAPNWESLSQNIFYPKCTSCHNPNGEAKFLDLSTRQAWFEGRDRDFGGLTLLDFENPSESYVMKVINDPFEPMPPAYSNIPVLSAEEKDAIEEWIRRGLP